jgi:hypothetical protein
MALNVGLELKFYNVYSWKETEEERRGIIVRKLM